VRYLGADLHAQGAKVLGYSCRCAEFTIAQLRIGVDIPAPLHDSRVHLRNEALDLVGQVGPVLLSRGRPREDEAGNEEQAG
jgi:hypothetical protein